MLVALLVGLVGFGPGSGYPLGHRPQVKPLDQFVEGKIDAFLATPPEPL